MSAEKNFQVNLGGVITLLSDHLYSSPDVFLRELLQNSVDAITARRQREPNYEGKIHIEVLRGDGGPTIVIQDDGIGLTESEIHQFLATIGQSSKSGDLSREDFIGQFGIGLLSAFVVSDTITVITQASDQRSPTLQWTGHSNGTYQVRALEKQLSVGTRVYLQPKVEKEEYFEPERIIELAKYFGRHLPYAITLQVGGRTESITEEAPWRCNYTSQAERRQAWLAYGRSTFGYDFLDAIPLRSSSGALDGIAFILPQAASPAARQSHRVYLKNMLLSESTEHLMPSWAFFVRCVVNSDSLRPNAARDAFFNDQRLSDAQHELGQCLKEYLSQLAREDRKRLDEIIQLHYLPIKALAVDDEDFFRLIIRWLPFETTHGSVTIDEHFRRHSSLCYVKDLDQFRQIAAVAMAQNLHIFNGGYTYDTELLERVAAEFPDYDVTRIEADDLVKDFVELTSQESQQVNELVTFADAVLEKYKCRVEVRRFVPEELPTLYTTSQSARFFRFVDQSTDQVDETWADILESVSEAVGGDAFAQLVLNFNHPLVQKLAKIKTRSLLQRVVEIVYLQSLLLGHYPLSADERQILANGLSGLIDYLRDDL